MPVPPKRDYGRFSTAAKLDDEPDISWLWHNRIPIGGMTSLEGMPGDGKSTISMDLAARITTGAPMPREDRRRSPGGVPVFNVEDTKGTIKRRAEAAGADLERLVVLGAEDVGLFGDLPRLEAAMDTVDAKLVIADPLMAALGTGTNAKNDQSVRHELTPLAEMLARRSAGVLVIRHPTKGGSGDPRYTGSGAVGVTAALRSVLVVAARPDRPGEYVLVHVKSNWGPEMPPIAYRIASAGTVGRVEWLESVVRQSGGGA